MGRRGDLLRTRLRGVRWLPFPSPRRAVWEIGSREICSYSADLRSA